MASRESVCIGGVLSCEAYTYLSMSFIKICSMNCRGLADLKKKRDLFLFLKSMDFKIIFLQDVHWTFNKRKDYIADWGSDMIVSFTLQILEVLLYYLIKTLSTRLIILKLTPLVISLLSILPLVITA